jgi:cation:H+ antiporter
MTFYVEIPFMILVTGIFILMGYTDACISRYEGVLLWILFLVYLRYLFYLSRKEAKEPAISDKPLRQLLFAMTAGAVIVVAGSNLTVNAATQLARIIGLSERFIGLTIVAFGTSLPELVTSVTAAKKEDADIAIGNIVGSNIFNILFVIGTSALIAPITYDSQFFVDGILAILSSAALWLFALRTKTLRRSGGLLMLLGYAAYFIYLIK